jgi:hypothetical protein
VIAAFAAAYAFVAATSPQPCTADPAFHALDFWVGTWDVYVGRERDGRDVVTRELDDCAVTERWEGSDGSRGMSLFVYDPYAGRWQQTWVTDRATQLGGLKFKTLVARYPSGGVRFAGVLPSSPSARPILDRTTLTPLAGGAVHQVIENSVDGGDHWKVSYDAVYRRVSRP